MSVQPRFRRLAALVSVLFASTSIGGLSAPVSAEALRLQPIPMPATREECLKMLDDLIMDMATYMGAEAFAGVYRDIPFDLAIKRDCEAGNFGAAHQQAVGMRPTSTSAPEQSPAKPSDCFLTTACCGVVGLEDNCMELSVLRGYRDRVLPSLPGGRAEVALYYALAPSILSALDSQTTQRCLARLYFTHIVPCVAMACLGFGELTRRRYRDMLARLCVAAGLRPALG